MKMHEHSVALFATRHSLRTQASDPLDPLLPALSIALTFFGFVCGYLSSDSAERPALIAAIAHSELPRVELANRPAQRLGDGDRADASRCKDLIDRSNHLVT